MRLFVVLGLFFSFAPVVFAQSTDGVAPVESAAQSEPVYDLDTVIIKPKASRFYSATQPLEPQEAQRLGLAPTPEPLGDGLYVFNLQSEFYSAQTVNGPERLNQLKDLVERLNQRSDIDYAELNQLAQPQITPNDPAWADQWNLKTWSDKPGTDVSQGGISMPQAWSKGQPRKRITVAVIDTGIVKDHPDIKNSGNYADGYDFISLKEIAHDGDGRDGDPTDPGDGVTSTECSDGRARPDSWHGNHVAGIIGLGGSNNGVGIAGINSAVRIVPIRALGKCGGRWADIAAAIRWAAGQDLPGIPKNKNKAQIINMSLNSKGKTCPRIVQDAIDEAVKDDVTIVAAAGNWRNDAVDNGLSSCNNVVVVAANDEQGDLEACYTSFGLRVDIMAPGGHLGLPPCNTQKKKLGVRSYVKVTPNNPEGLAVYQGTSMAAPHVAGVMALMLSHNPKLTRQELITIVKETARKRTPEQCPKRCGAGLLDAEKAVAAAIAKLTARPVPPSPAPRPPEARLPETPRPPAIRPRPRPIRPVCCCADYDCRPPSPNPPYPYPILYPDPYECFDDVYYTDYD